MSDGIEILTENHKEARELALLKRVDSNLARCYLSLDEALTRLERDRDALAERCEKLHEALRDECMYYRHSQWGRHGELGDGCNRCIQSWRSGTKERHAEGCLAAPKDASRHD